MLLMVEKGIRRRICCSIYQCSKANNKYIKGYDKNKELSYFQYWDVNNLYVWAMSQKFPVNNFEWIKDVTKSYNQESNKGYFLEADVQYLEKLHDLHSYLPFLPERMKIEKFEQLVANLHDKTKYVIHIKNLKEALNYELVLIKVHRVIKFNQNVWIEPYVGMNADLRKKGKIILKNIFLKLMNNADVRKPIENVRQHINPNETGLVERSFF